MRAAHTNTPALYVFAHTHSLHLYISKIYIYIFDMQTNLYLGNEHAYYLLVRTIHTHNTHHMHAEYR